MKNATFLLCLLCQCLFPVQGDALNSLRVSEPRFSWSTQQGTIEEAVLSVTPAGIYWEYGLYLTFSARGTTFSANDSLEVVLNFELPEAAIVHDSWLWINDNISRGVILDRWTASAVYEGIVQRRQDPSLLLKKSATQYELRVFPMRGNQTRKVKITFLMPTEWDVRKVSASLPLLLLTTSKNPLPQLSLLVWPAPDFQTPFVPDFPEVSFTSAFSAPQGTFFKATVPKSLYTQALRLSFASPMQQGCYFQKYDDDGEGIYQLAVLPHQFAPEQLKRKLLVLVDHDASGGGPAATAISHQIKNQLLNTLGPSDSFNVIFSNLPLQQLGASWMPADESLIQAQFNNLNSPLSSYSNLATLLAAGIAFIEEQGTGGEILLLSNAAQYSNSQVANALLNDIEALMTTEIPIHTLDYRTLNSPAVNIGGLSYIGNEYLLFTLSQLTSATFQKARQLASFEPLLTQILRNAGSIIQPFDLGTSVQNGFCYGRLSINGSTSAAFPGQALLQIGKYKGDLPFILEMAGEIHNQFFNAELELNDHLEMVGDSIMREMWYGAFIRTLESEPINTNVTFEIIAHSLSERVLSRYTAFLCLEDSLYYCDDCVDETNFVATNDMEIDTVWQAIPNPFHDQMEIRLNADLGQSSDLIIEIFGLDGRLVRQEIVEAKSAGTVWVWHGEDQQMNAAAPGMYVVMLQMGTYKGVKKVLKQ